ncbi:MAG: 2-oxo acid dehydrogenase subunit E2 [Candidatus Kariarchaeaceae archaeon]|jgi:pyruvate/2-oxoglutarate dehydrogenase complex dihydrolipoamide acyltransferase (E2) component
MKNIGNYEVKQFPTNRQILSDIYEEFQKKHYMTGFIEVDITKGREKIRNYHDQTGTKISFTGWIIKCIAQAVSEHNHINAYRKGRKQVIEFKEIDIIIMIERFLTKDPIPIPYVLRNTSTKSLLEISNEIRKAQMKEVDEKDQLLDSGFKLKLYPYIPKFIRKLILRRMINNPFTMKAKGGAIVITSVSAFANTYGWVSNFGGLTTLNIALGGKTNRSVVEDQEIVEREIMNMTINIDHDIVDGAPATRFVSRMVELMQSGYGFPHVEN